MNNLIKFNKKIQDFKYILSFDLAKRVTGYSLVDVVKKKIMLAGIIDTTPAGEFVWEYFYNEINKILDQSRNVTNFSDILILKEKMPTQNGRFSTIATLQGLAQAHAIFDLAITHRGFSIYDYDGVHATVVKTYFKSLLDIEKPQKEDIAKYIQEQYKDFDLSKYTLDVTDSIAVTLALIGRKWNMDIIEEIKLLKKEQKKAKTKNKIKKISNKIEYLESLKI